MREGREEILHINTPEPEAAEKAETPEAGEIKERFGGQRLELAKDFLGRLAKNTAGYAKPIATIGARHLPLVGGGVEALELIRGKNMVTGAELTRYERLLRVCGVAFESIAVGLLIASAQSGEAQKVLVDFKVALQSAFEHGQFGQLLQAIHDLESSPHTVGATVSAAASSAAGHLQELATAGAVVRKLADRINIPVAGMILEKVATAVSAAKKAYGK